MGFEVEVTDEFTDWYFELTESEQDALGARIDLLAERGSSLKRPVVAEVVGSRNDPQLKELRVSARQASLRVLFIFDPRRTAILLLGGNKAGSWNSWYQAAIPEADRLYGLYLEELREDGLL